MSKSSSGVVELQSHETGSMVEVPADPALPPALLVLFAAPPLPLEAPVPPVMVELAFAVPPTFTLVPPEPVLTELPPLPFEALVPPLPALEAPLPLEPPLPFEPPLLLEPPSPPVPPLPAAGAGVPRSMPNKALQPIGSVRKKRAALRRVSFDIDAPD
jgi:hypothetical protein